MLTCTCSYTIWNTPPFPLAIHLQGQKQPPLPQHTPPYLKTLQIPSIHLIGHYQPPPLFPFHCHFLHFTSFTTTEWHVLEWAAHQWLVTFTLAKCWDSGLWAKCLCNNIEATYTCRHHVTPYLDNQTVQYTILTWTYWSSCTTVASQNTALHHMVHIL